MRSGIWIRSLAAVIGLALSATASAAFTNAADADFSWTTDSSTGLDWLDFSAPGGIEPPANHASTVGRSYLEVLSELNPGGDYEGWRYATREEAVLFIQSIWGAPIAPLGAPFAEYAGLTAAVAMYTGYTRLDNAVQIFGYVDDIVGDQIKYYGGVGTYALANSDGFFSSGYPIDPSQGYPGWGHWLVRETPVPVPPTVLLVGIGLIGFAASHRPRR